MLYAPEDAAWAPCLWNFYKYLGQLWAKLSKFYELLPHHSTPNICVFSASYTHTYLELYIQEENISLVKMKMLEHPRKQSWKKVKGMLLYITYTHTYIYIIIAVVCLVYSWCHTWFKYYWYKSMWSSHSPKMSTTLWLVVLTSSHPLWSNKEGMFNCHHLWLQIALLKNMVWTLSLQKLSLVTKHFSNIFGRCFTIMVNQAFLC